MIQKIEFAKNVFGIDATGDVLKVKNPTSVDFECGFDGEPVFIKAGETIVTTKDKAIHVAKQISKQLIVGQNMLNKGYTNKMWSRNDLVINEAFELLSELDLTAVPDATPGVVEDVEADEPAFESVAKTELKSAAPMKKLVPKKVIKSK